MFLKESSFEVTASGRPFFVENVPENAIFTKLRYNPENFHLVIYYLDSGDKKVPHYFDLTNDFSGEREGRNAKYAGQFQHKHLLWYIFCKKQ